MFYSVEAAMANYRDKSSQPSKLDGGVNQHRYKIAKDSFYENFSLKNQFRLLYHDDDDSLDSCKLKSIVNALMKYIEDAPMKMQYSIDFAKDVRKRLLCLHYDIGRFLKHNKQFPFSSELHNLLVRYVEFEHDILYHPKNFSKEYEKVVQKQILYLLQSIFYDPIGVRKKLVSSPDEASAINSLYILKNLKPEYKKSRALIESMMTNLLTKLNILDEINEMKRKDSDINFDKILKVSQVQKMQKYLDSRNYYDNEDFNNSDDEFDVEIGENDAIKREIKVEEHNQNDYVELIVSSNQQCIIIDLDSDSEDRHSLDVRKNTLDLSRKRAHTSASLSKSQLNSSTTSNFCDNKRLLLNSDKSRVLNLCDNENRFSDTNNCKLSNSKNGLPHNKIQNATTKRNVVDETDSDKDSSLHMIYEDSQYENFQLKKELLLLDSDEHLCIPSKLYDITEKLKRYIDDCPKSIRFTRKFVNGIHRTLIYLYESMCRLVKGNREFLSSPELHALLVTYIELEYEVLYDSKNFSKHYEESVQNRILRLLLNMLFNPTVDGNIKQYVKSAEEASSLSTLYVVRSIKPEYKKQHSLVENIMNKLMLKLNVLDNINELRSKNKNIQLQQLLTIPQFNKIYKYLHNRDFGIDDCNSTEDHLDMVEVKPSIKNEEIDMKPDVGAYFHLDKRKPMVIDLDEDDDDCFMICDEGNQLNKTVIKTENNSSQNILDTVLIKHESNSNHYIAYPVSNLCNNESNACIIVIDDDDDNEEGSVLLEKSNSIVACVSNISSDELEEELLQLEDAASDIQSEDENEVLNRFTDDELDTNEKINSPCHSVQKSNDSNSSNMQTTTLDQQLTSEVETSNDKTKTDAILLQNEVSIEFIEGTISNSCSSTENIDTIISEEHHETMTNKSNDLPSLTNAEVNPKVTETIHCSSDITVESDLMSKSNKDLTDNIDISEEINTTNSTLKSDNENLTIEKDINLPETSTSILNIPSGTDNLSLAIKNISNENSKLQVLNETDFNDEMHNIQEIQYTEENDCTATPKDSTLNIQDANENSQVQYSISNTECIEEEESDSISKNSSANLNEQDKSDNFNLEIGNSLNKNCEIQEDVNLKQLILSSEENNVQDNKSIKIDEQICNIPPQKFKDMKLSENENLDVGSEINVASEDLDVENEVNVTSENLDVVEKEINVTSENLDVIENEINVTSENLDTLQDEINITSANSDLVENEVAIFQEKSMVDACEDIQLLENENSNTIENEISASSGSPELFGNEESVIHTDLEERVDLICERSDSSEHEESIIAATECEKEVLVTVENEVHVACENSDSFESESVIVHTENEQCELIMASENSDLLENAIPTANEHLFIGNTQFEVFCQASNENAELNIVEHLEVHTEVDVVSDDLNEELCNLEDQSIQPKKDTIDDLQSTSVEDLEVQKLIEVTSENDEIYEDGSNTSKYDFNLQDNYVKETINNEGVIENDVTEELHIEIQDPIAVDNINCEEGLKSNATFNNHNNNLLSVLAQVASEQQKMEDSLEMQNKNKKKAVTKGKGFNKKKQNTKTKKLGKGSVAVKRVTRSTSLKAKENLDACLLDEDACFIPSNFLENFVSPPPHRVYNLIPTDASINEESVDGSDSDQNIQQFDDMQVNTLYNPVFDEDTIEDGIEFVLHRRKNNQIVQPEQEIDGNNTSNIETNNTKAHHLENIEYTFLNFPINTSETFTERDINDQFNVELLFQRDEETKALETKSKAIINKKSKKVKSNELSVNNEKLDSCCKVKATPKKTRKLKLDQNIEKPLNSTKNQKLHADSISVKIKGKKCNEDKKHIPYEKNEEMIVQDVEVENVTEAELEIEIITEEIINCELSDIQINDEVAAVPNIVPDVDLNSSNSVTNRNVEEKCLTDNILNTIEEVVTKSTPKNESNNYQKCKNKVRKIKNQINLSNQKNDFEPESKVSRKENEQLIKSTKLRNSKVKSHSKDDKTVTSKEKITEIEYDNREKGIKGEKKNSFKIIEDSKNTKISNSPLVITKNSKSSKITKQNSKNNIKIDEQKLLKSNKFQCSSRSNIKYIVKNNLSKKLGIRKKSKIITKKKMQFLRESLKKTVKKDHFKKRPLKSGKKLKEPVQVESNIEISKTNQDNNSTEAPIKSEHSKKKRRGKKVLPKSEFLNEENWICSPIEPEFSKNEIDVPSKPLENSVEETITKTNQEISLMKETELDASNNLKVNSALVDEHDSIDSITENKEPININSKADKTKSRENVTDNFDYEEIVIESSTVLKGKENEVVEVSKEDENETVLKSKENKVVEVSKEDENETIRTEDQLTDANSTKEPCKDIENATTESSAGIMECDTAIIDVNISKNPNDDLQNTVSVKESNTTIEQESTTQSKENTDVQESNIDELLKNDLPSMNTLVEEIKTKKRKLSETEHVQDLEKRLSIEEFSVPPIQFCEMEKKTIGKFSKRRLRSSKADSKSQDIESITENLRSRSYQKIKKNTTKGTKISLENLSIIKSNPVVEITKIDIERINAKMLKDNTKIMKSDDNKKDKVNKEANATSEIMEENDNKRNMAEKLNTISEITEVDDDKTNQKVVKETMMVDDKSNQEVEKEANTTFEITKIDNHKTNKEIEKEEIMIDANISNQQVKKIVQTTFELLEVDDNTPKQKVEIEAMMIDGNKSNQEVKKVAHETFEIAEVNDTKTNSKVEKVNQRVEKGRGRKKERRKENITFEITEVDDNKTNDKVEKEPVTIDENKLNTTFEITEVHDYKANQEMEKEVMLIDDKISNPEVEKEATKIDYPKTNEKVEKADDNKSNQGIEKERRKRKKDRRKENTTSQIITVDHSKTNVEIEKETNTICEITKIDDNKEIEEKLNSTFKITEVDDKETKQEANAVSEITKVDDNKANQEIEESYTTSKDSNELQSDTFIEISVRKTNEDKLEEINTICESFNELGTKELLETVEVDNTVMSGNVSEEENSISQNSVIEVDKRETNAKIIEEVETINENLNEFENDKYLPITESDDNETSENVIKETLENEEDNCMEIGGDSKSSEESNATNCMEIAKVDDANINSKSSDEMNAVNCMEITEVDDITLNGKSSEETNAANCMKIAEVDYVNISRKSPEETNAIPETLFENSGIIEVNSNNKINEKTLEDINTTSKNPDEFEKDYLIDNSKVDAVQFSMMDEKRILNDAGNLPTTVEEINMLHESEDNDDQDNKIDEHNLKGSESLNKDNLLVDRNKSDNYFEKVVEMGKNINDEIDMHQEMSKECENFDKQEYKGVTEKQTDFTFNEFEFPKNLHENVTNIEIGPPKNVVSSAVETLNENFKNDYSVTNESEYPIEEVTIQSSILSPKNLQHIVDSVKDIPATEILEEIVDCHGLLNSKGFEDSILAYSEKMKEGNSSCLLQIANETIVETSQVTPSTSLSDNCETSSNFLQAMFSHQSSETVFIYLEGSDHNYHSVGDPLLSAKYGTTDEIVADSLNQVKEIPTPELENEDNIIQFISTQAEGNLNQELSTSLNETSVNNSADFQLLEQCLMENGLGHESSTTLPQRVSCDNVFQHTLKQEFTEYDENSRNSNLEFCESNEEVNIDSFQQNEMSTEKMIELMKVWNDIKHLNHITTPVDAEVSNEQTQNIMVTTFNRDFGDPSNTSGFTNKSSSELQESPTKLIRDIFDATSSIEHADSISVAKSISFDTDFSNIYFSGIQDPFLTRDRTSNKKVIVERIVPPELTKCTNVNISVGSSDNKCKLVNVHRSPVSIPKSSPITPKKKSPTLIEPHAKFTLQVQPKVKKSTIDNKLLLDHCLKRHSTRTQVLAPKRKQLNELPKTCEILSAKSNTEPKMETIHKVSLDKDESRTRNCNELDIKKLSRRRTSEKTRFVNDIVKDGRGCNVAMTSKKEDATSKKEVESKTNKNFNKHVTSYLEDLYKQNTTRENDNKSFVKSGSTSSDSHFPTINYTISPTQQKVKDNFEQALSKNDLIDNVKSRKRKPVDYVEKSERKKNYCDINKKLPYKGNQKKVEFEDPIINKTKGKRKLDQSDEKDAKIKNKFYETEESKLHNISDNSLPQKEKSWEDLDDNISKKKKPRLNLPEPNPMDAIFDRLRQEGNVNEMSNKSTNNYSNRNPVSLPTYEHFNPRIQNGDKHMVNLQKSTSNSISIFNKGVQRTADNKPKKIAIVAPIKSNVKKEPSSRTNRTSEHDWLDKMKHAFPQEFTNEVSFEYERGNDISRSTHQH